MTSGSPSTSSSTKELQPLTAALLECNTPHDVAHVIVKHGMLVLGAETGLVALLTEDGTSLETLEADGYGEEQPLNQFSISANFPLSNVVRLGKPMFVPTQSEWEMLYPEIPSDLYRVTKAALDLPLADDGVTVGGLHFSFGQERPFDDADRAFATEMARQCALAMGRALARQRVDVVQRRMSFLVQASAVLNEAFALDKVLYDLTHLVTPELSDYAQVAIVNADGSINRIAVAHEDPEREAMIHEFYSSYSPDPAKYNPTFAAIASGKIQHLHNITDEMLQQAAIDARHLRLLRQLALTSTLTIPLIARERTVGAMTFAMSTDSIRVFAPTLIDFLQELSGRAATTIDNALLYADAKREIDRRVLAEAEREAIRIENARLIQAATDTAQQQRTFQANVISSITDGRLVLCEFITDLPQPLSDNAIIMSLATSSDISAMRSIIMDKALQLQYTQERISDLLTAISEAGMNAFVHAGGGQAKLFVDTDQGNIQIWIIDQGKGIEYDRLPEAMFRKGYSSAGTLGHGFKLILMFADYVYVMTSPTGTTVVIEQHREKPAPPWGSIEVSK